jgi:6-phosphogluconolactonase/glucosamine-6-phosphate isomerase/deaminase
VAIEFRTFPTERQAGDALYNELRRSLGENPEYHVDEDGSDLAERTAISPHVVMLAGGSTPLKVYRRIAQEPPRHVHPATHLMLSDDRYVAATDERSNYGQVRPLALALGLPEDRLIHVNPDLPLPEAVHDFGTRIADVGSRDGIFSLGILGIGSDGHTASLFTPDLVEDLTGAGTADGPAPGSGTLLTSDPGRLALHTGEHGGLHRVSVGSAVLLSFRTLIFFATGHGKRDILYELSRRPENYPAGRILLQHPNATIWTDEAPRVR